jgi:stress response protein SCP2
LKAEGVEHSGDDRVGLPADLKDGYNEKIDIDLTELALSGIVCTIFYVSCYNGTLFKDCRSGSVQVKQLSGESNNTQQQQQQDQQDHLFIYETLLKTKSRFSGLVPCMFLYDSEEMLWEMTVLNEWILDCHFLDGMAKVLNRKVLPNRVWQPLCERLEHKILDTLNKEQKLQKKRRRVDRKRNKASAQDQSEGSGQADRQNIMEATITNEIRELIKSDKDPYVLDPLDQQVILHSNNKRLLAEYKTKRKLREIAQTKKKDESVDDKYAESDNSFSYNSGSDDDDEDDDYSSSKRTPNRKQKPKKEYPTYELDAEANDVVELGLGWDSKPGHLHSQYYLSSNLIMFGKYGHKISFVDQRTSAKVKCCSYFPNEYIKSGKNDRVLTIKLKDVEQNVKSIVFVVVASSNTDFHGLSDLRNPYVRLSFKDGIEILRYGFPDEASQPGSSFYSLITFKLVRADNDPSKWRVVPIVELSDGTHGLFHDKLRSQIAKHVERLKEPELSVLTSSSTGTDDTPVENTKATYDFSSKDFSNVGIDFTCIKNIKEIACFELGKYGDIKNTRSFAVSEKQDLSQRKMSIQMSGLSYIKTNELMPEMLVSATSFIRTNLDKLYSDGVYHVVWVITFKELVEDDPLDNDRCIIDDGWCNVFRVWNINDRNDLASCLVSNVYNVDGKFENFSDVQLCGTAIAKLSRTTDDPQATWSLRCIDEVIPFKTRISRNNDSKRIKQTRYLKSIEKFLSIPKDSESKILYGSTKKDIVPTPYEITLPTDLVIGIGVEGSRAIHMLEMNVEQYDHCGSFIEDLNTKQPKYRDNLFHTFRQLYLPTGNDSEQFTLTRTSRTPIRHYAITAQAMGRGYLSPSDTVYVRFCAKQTCQELARVNCEASALLTTYQGRKIDLSAVKTIEEMSDDEESYASDKEDEPYALLAMVTYTQSGWKITPAGRIVTPTELFQSFIPPAPTHIRIEIIEAFDVKPMDKTGTSADPYIKLKLKNANALKKKSKQKYQTKTQHKTLNPKWAETCEFAVTSPDEVLLFAMYNYDGPLRVRHEMIGTCKISVYDAISNANEGVITAISILNENRVVGKLKVRPSRVWK